MHLEKKIVELNGETNGVVSKALTVQCVSYQMSRVEGNKKPEEEDGEGHLKESADGTIL